MNFNILLIFLNNRKNIIIFISVFSIAFLVAFYLFFLKDYNTDFQIENKSDSENISLPVEEPKPDNLMKKQEENKELKIMAVGDIMLSRFVEMKMKEKNDWKYPFLNTADYLRGGDIVFGNLETSILNGREIKSGEMVFRADERVVESLKSAGFNFLSLANNHILNFGSEGLKSTLDNLNEAGIIFSGAGFGGEAAFKPVVVEKNGLKIGLFSYAYNGSKFATTTSDKATVAGTDKVKMIEDVKALRDEVDLLIVSLHAGHEYNVPASENQISFSRAAIDAGADLVFGHHAHIVQGIEKYGDGVIFYGLGNFVFDQMFNKWVRRGMIAEINFSEKKGVEKIFLKPTVIEDYARPRFATPEEAREVFERVNISYVEENGNFVYNFNIGN